MILKARSDRAAASASALTLWKEYIAFYLFHSHQASVAMAAALLAMMLGIGLGPIFKLSMPLTLMLLLTLGLNGPLVFHHCSKKGQRKGNFETKVKV